MAKMRVPDDFKEFLKLLNEKQVEYLVVGGYAVFYHGYTRTTADIDIWLRMDPDNAERISQALEEFGFNPSEYSKELFLKKDQIIRMGHPPLRIELMTTISGVEFDECYNSRVTTKWDDVKVDLLDLEKLKINKKAAGRHKDLSDLENLP